MAGERQTGPDPMTTETAEMFLRRAERAEAEVERVRADFAAYVDVARLKATQFGERVRDAQAERDAYKAKLTRLVAGIQWVRGMCSDEEPYEVIDAWLAGLLDEDHETSDAVRGDPCGTPVEWPGRQPTDPDRGQLRDAAIPASGRGRQSEIEAERDAYKAALERIAETPGLFVVDIREAARSVLAGESSTTAQ